jgi:urease subunit alpha
VSILIDRRDYGAQYEPTTGDRIHLADTGLLAKVEADLTTYGDELVFGTGKTIRDGMGQVSRFKRSDGALDFVITNAVLIDPLLGSSSVTSVYWTARSWGSARPGIPTP